MLNKKDPKKQTAIEKAGEVGNIEKVGLTFEFGKVYVKIRNGEILEPVRAQITLFERLGHINKIKDTYSVSIAGYRLLNTVASVSIATPQAVIVDGVAQPNPYIERNKETKLVETVHVRKIGIGLSLLGNVVIVDKTLCYNIKTYFLQSIQAKMKKVLWENNKRTDKPAHPNAARLGEARIRPKDAGDWIFFDVEPPLGIWVNYSDPAILDCLEEHTQRQRFGDRIAQTIVERNILKDHPAIAVSTVVPKTFQNETVAYVTVYGYRHQLEPKDIGEILARGERGEEAIEVKAETIAEVLTEEEREAIEDAEKADEPKKKFAEPFKDSPSKMTEDEAREQGLFKEKK